MVPVTFFPPQGDLEVREPTMDNDPRPGDDVPAAAELSGVLREAVESIRGEAAPEAVLSRVLERARQVPAAAVEPRQGPHDSGRRRTVIAWASRGLAAALAVAVLAAASIWTVSIFRHAAPTLAAALQATLAAQTLELKLTRDGKTSGVWIRGGELRRNRPDGTYQITRGDRLWTVDERENRASSEPSPFEGYDPGPVLLVLMNVPPEEGLLNSTPAEAIARRPALRHLPLALRGPRRAAGGRGGGRGRQPHALLAGSLAHSGGAAAVARPVGRRRPQPARGRCPVRRRRHPDRGRPDRQGDRHAGRGGPPPGHGRPLDPPGRPDARCGLAIGSAPTSAGPTRSRSAW